MKRAILLCLFVIGCGRSLQPEAPAQSPAGIVQMARARPVPDLLRARFNIKVKSKPLNVSGSTGGGLVTARPGKGHLAVMGPLGSTLVSFTSDGQGMAVLMARKKQHLAADNAEAVLQELTGGAAGMDDVLSVLVGDLPFDAARVRKKTKLRNGNVRVLFAGPDRTEVEAVLEPVHGTLVRLDARSRKGETLLTATYEPFEPLEDGTYMPSRVELVVPRVELTVNLKYKKWERMESAPDVFHTAAPKGVQSKPLELAALEALGEGAADLQGGSEPTPAEPSEGPAGSHD